MLPLPRHRPRSPPEGVARGELIWAVADATSSRPRTGSRSSSCAPGPSRGTTSSSAHRVVRQPPRSPSPRRRLAYRVQYLPAPLRARRAHARRLRRAMEADQPTGLSSDKFCSGGSSERRQLMNATGSTGASRGTTDHQQRHHRQRRLRSTGARARRVARSRPRQPAGLARDVAGSRRDGAGPKTYEGLAAVWPQMADLPGLEAYAEQMNSMPKYVASRTLRGPLEWNASLLEGNLKDKHHGNLVVSGAGELARELMAHGLVDEVWFTVSPYLWATGPRIFDDVGAVRLELVSTTTFPSGVVRLCYRPAPADTPSTG